MNYFSTLPLPIPSPTPILAAAVCMGLTGCASHPAIPTKAPNDFVRLTEHLTKPGDTLWELARKYNPYLSTRDDLTREVEAMKRLNGMNCDLILPNKLIRIPTTLNLVAAPQVPSLPFTAESLTLVSPPANPNAAAKSVFAKWGQLRLAQKTPPSMTKTVPVEPPLELTVDEDSASSLAVDPTGGYGEQVQQFLGNAAPRDPPSVP